jgi:hypothetical protein
MDDSFPLHIDHNLQGKMLRQLLRHALENLDDDADSETS